MSAGTTNGGKPEKKELPAKEPAKTGGILKSLFGRK